MLTLALAAVIAQTGVPPEALKAYARVLNDTVKDGRVNYKLLEEKYVADLDGFLAAVATAKAPPLKSDAVALYADAYNALVLRAVLKHKRPRSVLDVPGFFDKLPHTVTGRAMTLDHLEKMVINPLAKDPRTHMILVCAAVSCPILENKPYSGSNLAQRMDAAARRFLASPLGAEVGAGSIALSKIFDWYEADFGGKRGVVEFATKHLPMDKVKLLGAEPELKFLEYNWTLNQQ